MSRLRWRGWLLAAVVALVATACSSTSAASDDTDDSMPASETAEAISVEEAVRLLGSRQLSTIEQPTWEGASAVGAEVPLYADTTSTTPTFVLPNPTHEGQLLSFRVAAHDEASGRIQVQLPMRPNQSLAWIDPASVTTFPIERRFVVDISDRTLSVYDGLKLVFRELVAVGAPETPTPLGTYYIDFSMFPAPFPEYENGMISLAAFSEVHLTFGGGIGQLAIHGWSDPSAMGRNVSNGCIRVTPDLIDRLVPLVGPGTPVEIIA